MEFGGSGCQGLLGFRVEIRGIETLNPKLPTKIP